MAYLPFTFAGTGRAGAVGSSVGLPCQSGAMLCESHSSQARHRCPPCGLLPHSDRGVQYASGEYRELLKAGGLEPSMSRKGSPYDNAVMESFNATYKRECVGLAEERGGYATRAEATADFFDYVEKYYNRERRHSALGYKSPVDFENQLN